MSKKPTLIVKAKPTIIDVMDGPLADSFDGPSWDRWRAILKGAFGLPMTEEELESFREVTDRDPPGNRVRELWVVGGRRGGKDSVASLIIAHAASLFDGKRRQIAGISLPALRRGERATIFCFGRDRDQARLVLGYVRDYFASIPELKAMLTRETRDGFELSNGVDVIIGTGDYRSVRGRAVLLCVMDEVAFFEDENSATPDIELYNAVTPGMLTLHDQAMLIGISTPHTKSGLLWDKYREKYGTDDPAVLVVKATSMQLNPTLPAEIIEAEIASDPARKRSEYLCEWREDISGFVSSEIVDAATIKKQVLSPIEGVAYTGFIDISGGSKDSHTCAVAFKDSEGCCVLAATRELKSENTESVVAEFAAMLKSYGVTTVWGDRYGAFWVVDAFGRHGITLKHSPHSRSELYLNLLPMLSAGQAKLLDIKRLRSQLLALERRTIRGTGREIVDHPSKAGAADDLSNCVAGALVMVASAERSKVIWHFGSSGTTPSFLSSFRSEVASVVNFLRDGFAGEDHQVEQPQPIYLPAASDNDPDEPTPDDPGYYRMRDIHNGVRIDGKPLKWREIREKVEKENEVMAKWG
jgi:hypothetical protein